jgi:hypothetical protein
LSFLYLSWSFLISGCSCAIDCIDLNCFSVSGSSSTRMRIVRQTIAIPQPIPRSWNQMRICSKKLMSGWSGFAAKTGMGGSGV